MSSIIIPAWPAPSIVHAYSTTRHDGVSSAPYASFNLGMHVGDDSADVLQNRKILADTLQLPQEPIWLSQVHGSHVLKLKEGEIYACPEADASITQDVNLVCTVMTADCLPILVCNSKGTWVGAIHAGWQGLANGIIAQTISKIDESPDQLLAWLGPAIGPDTFEVSDDLKMTFVELDPRFASAFRSKKPGKWLANIYELANLQLKTLGVNNIYGGDQCTYTDHENFFSYRRDRGITGRMATLIWLSA